ncbi:energy-coupling factor transporter transmembrane component T family protein [Salirhabdus salicampi]|uniref:energy-coupling factor transporter transmembrane component T family protein n=1 Tax=Salirhabdus salicampi TaxID=476102 RepID=UPI0020C37014|nr:energy-coupling factor transporter transmembrane component T [Salirhabdus salicampi]MCP8615889.1 energy-coupling factor transporter transmembrane protein EcfT [Salirhabdus salicampi]
MLANYQKSNHFLQKVNPVAKLASLFVVIGFLAFVFDPWTPLCLLIITIMSITLLGNIPIRFLLFILLPFTLFAFSFLWIQVVFPDETGATILFHIGSFPVALENVMVGLSLGLRSLVFVSWSMLFVLTTEPTKLMLSLIQNCKLPPRFGYGVMAAYQFLPMFRQELNQMRTAHRIRGLGKPKGFKERVKEMKRYTVPLLASGIRKAERVAIAMESKGFDGGRDRSYYDSIRWTRYDVIYFGGILIVFLSLYVLRKVYTV